MAARLDDVRFQGTERKWSADDQNDEIGTLGQRLRALWDNDLGLAYP